MKEKRNIKQESAFILLTTYEREFPRKTYLLNSLFKLTHFCIYYHFTFIISFITFYY